MTFQPNTNCYLSLICLALAVLVPVCVWLIRQLTPGPARRPNDVDPSNAVVKLSLSALLLSVAMYVLLAVALVVCIGATIFMTVTQH